MKPGAREDHGERRAKNATAARTYASAQDSVSKPKRKENQSETVDLDGVGGNNLLVLEERLELQTLITLELDDLSSLFVFDKGAVASEFLQGYAESAMQP